MISLEDINFRNLAYEAGAGLYVCDRNGAFIFANIVLADIFHVEHPKNLIGKNLKDFVTPEYTNEFIQQFKDSMDSGKKSITIFTQITRKDGKTADIEVNAMPFFKDQVVSGSQGVVHDLTEYRQTVNKIMFSSTHDHLTGIYNQTFFETEMKRLERGRQFPISVIVIFVEGLDYLLNSKARELGEKTLVRVARQLFYAFRGDDIVARIGEKEFAVLLPNIDEDTIEKINSRIQVDLQKIKDDMRVSSLQFAVGAGTAKIGESLNAGLKKAEAIADLQKKSGSNP